MGKTFRNGKAIANAVLSLGDDRLQKKCDLTGSLAYEFYYSNASNEDIHTILNGLNTSSVTNMSLMFASCSGITSLPVLDTSNVTNMGSMFSSCTNLTGSIYINMQNVTSAIEMFNRCSNIVEIHLSNTSKISNRHRMFQHCSKVETIETIDLIAFVGQQSDIFYNCSSLKNLIVLNIKEGLSVSNSPLLTVDSLIGLIKECIRMNARNTLNIGSTNLAKLTDVYVKLTSGESLIPVGQKGEIEICESTDAGAMTISDYMNLKNWNIS